MNQQSHLIMAHRTWEAIVMPGDLVIDATCGNGHDTLFLAKLALTSQSGALFAFDIQPQALENTQRLVQTELPADLYSRIKIIRNCHSKFPEEILTKSVKLIVYNLGYLPGGNKNQTTMTNTTLESIASAQELIADEGLISVTCYPGHPEGKVEEEALLTYAASLDPRKWNCTHHRWLNRKNSPTLLFISKGGNYFRTGSLDAIMASNSSNATNVRFCKKAF